MFKPYLHLQLKRKPMQINRFPKQTRLVALMAFIIVLPTLAESDDFKQPITVDSKTQFVDGKRKTSFFRDDVHVRQGSLKIDADEVEVNAVQGEGREIFIARGAPAAYSQTMEDGSDIRAVALEIKYETANRTLTLSGKAELHQNSSMVKGESITYNLDKQQLLAQGSAGENSRVTTVFRPESEGSQPSDENK